MGTIAQKLNYSLEAKDLIKDGINNLGGNVTDETTLKEYRDELDSVYNKLPKVSNSTASDNVTLNPTLEGRIDSTMYGQIGQDTTTGKNKFGFNNWYQDNNATHSIINVNKLEVTATRTNAYANSKFKVNLEDGTYTFSLGKVTNSNSEMTTKRMTLAYYINNTRTAVQHIDEGTPQTITITNETGKEYILEFWGNYSTNIANTAIYEEVQIEPGSAKTNWEEYTGGIPSPNPNYEQPVKCVTGENTVRVKSAQLIDFASKTDTGYSFENDTLVYESSQRAYAGVQWDISESIKNNQGKKLYFSYESINVSNQVGSIAFLRLSFSDGTAASYNTLLNHNLEHISYTIPNDTSNINKAFFAIYSNNSNNNTDDYSVTIVKPQLQFGEVALPYSKYVTPQEKELDLGELEVYENGYFSRENGKWYLNNEFGKYIFTGNELWTKSTAYSTNDKLALFGTEQWLPNGKTSNYLTTGKCNLLRIGNYPRGDNNVISLDKQVHLSIDTQYLSENSVTGFQNYCRNLYNNNTPLYGIYELQTPSKTEITNQTLINQLNDIYKLMSYDGTTIIETECEEGNMPIIISASALKGE